MDITDTSTHPSPGVPRRDPAVLDEKLARLQRILRDMGSVLVAYSGGVDSTLVLKVANDLLHGAVLGVTAHSTIEVPGEAERAATLARGIGVPHRIVETDDLSNPTFVANPPDRCYHCKRARFAALREIAAQEGLAWVVDGTNADDASDYRPGMRALAELGIRSPLREAGLRKADIRELARALGLPNWNKPSTPCLATRFPYYTPLTVAGLTQVGQAEEFLWNLGLNVTRVRHHGSLARIEVPPDEFQKILSHRQAVLTRLRELGFTYVTLDLAGYRSGSMDEENPRLEAMG